MSFNEWREVALGDVISFNPKESLKKGTIAKKIGMDKLNPFNRNIQGFEKTEFKSGTKFRNGDTLLARITPCLENGKTAQVGILDENEIGFGSTEFIIMREKNNETINDFIYYLAISSEFRNIAIKSMTGTSGRQRAQKDVLEKTVIKLPCLDEQKSIAHILSTIDEKIEVNNKISKNLENMAQAIFKQWFVNFEFPCIPDAYWHHVQVNRANYSSDFEKICTYKRVGGLPVPDGKSWFVYVLLCEDGSFYKGMTNDLYRRFYEHYTGNGAEWTKVHKPVKVIHYEKFDTQEQARKREEQLKSGIGREWLKTEYEKYTKSLDKKAGAGLPAHQFTFNKADTPSNECRLMMAGEMVESELGMIPKGWEVKKLGDLFKFVKGKKPKIIKEKLFDEANMYLTIDVLNNKSILYCSTDKMIQVEKFNSLMVMDGASSGTLYYGKNGIVASTLAKIELIDKTIKDDFIYYALKSYEDEIKSHTTGSAIPHTDKEYVKKLKVCMTKESMIMKLFNKNINFIRNKIIIGQEESFRLKEIRDTLLPKLMSGEIRVLLDN